jgi:hypothetical protein
MVGPALLQPFRAVRYPLYDADGNFMETDKDDPDTMATTCPEEHGAGVITAEEKRKLEENLEVVDTLEDIFSLTYVASRYPPQSIFYCRTMIDSDRTGPHKKIATPKESWRFRQAVYRIWLCTSIFPGDCYEIDLIQRQHTAMLSEYPTNDLFQLYAVVRFFCGILESVPAGDEENNNREYCSLTQAQALRQLIYYPQMRILTSFCLWGRAVLLARGKIAQTNSSKRTHCITVTFPSRWKTFGQRARWIHLKKTSLRCSGFWIRLTVPTIPVRPSQLIPNIMVTIILSL